MVLLTPPGRSLTAPLSSLIDAATASLQWRTDLRVLSPEQAGVDSSQLQACGARRRMTCWARTVRASLRRSGAPARLAFIVVGQPIAPDRDRLYTLLLDVEDAALLYRSANREDPDWQETVEDRIFRGTAQSRPADVESATPDALQAYFEQVLTQTLRDQLVEKGHWWPSGQLEIRGAPEGLPVEIDHRQIVDTRPTRTEIAPLQAGLREVVVRGPGEHEVREMIEVPVAGRAVIDWTPPPEGTSAARLVTQWGGLGVVAAGAVLAGVGWARASEVDSLCIVRSGSADCPAVGAVTFGFDPDQAPTTRPDEVNPGGVQLSSLGLALMASGAAWSAGSWLLGDDSEPPWWAWLAGTLLGGATYAVAAVAQGG